MWNYYTKNEKNDGYSLTFEINELLLKINSLDKSEPLYRVFAFPVIYSEGEENELTCKILDQYMDLFEKYPNYEKEIIEDCCDLFYSIRYCFKHHSFDYEKEFRIIFEILDHDYWQSIKNRIIKFRQNKGIFIPYIDISCVNDYALIKVTTSPLLKDDIVVQGLSSLLYQNELENILVITSDCPKRY